MLTYLGYSAWIVSDEGEVVEYEPAVDPKTRKVSCWIPSVTGKQFVVHWKDHGGDVDTATYLYLDGFVVPGHFLYGKGEAKRGAMRTGSTSEKPFEFAKVMSDTRGGKLGAKELGTIKVKIKRVKRGQAHEANLPQKPPRHTELGQRAAGDQCIGYGQERPTTLQMPSTWNVEPHDPENPGTFVTFVFRYRPKEFLVSQGIMSPKDPICTPIREAVDEDDDTTPPATPAFEMPQYSPQASRDPECSPIREAMDVEDDRTMPAAFRTPQYSPQAFGTPQYSPQASSSRLVSMGPPPRRASSRFSALPKRSTMGPPAPKRTATGPLPRLATMEPLPPRQPFTGRSVSLDNPSQWGVWNPHVAAGPTLSTFPPYEI